VALKGAEIGIVARFFRDTEIQGVLRGMIDDRDKMQHFGNIGDVVFFPASGSFNILKDADPTFCIAPGETITRLCGITSVLPNFREIASTGFAVSSFCAY
jgi:hypothetical protein